MIFQILTNVISTTKEQDRQEMTSLLDFATPRLLEWTVE